MTKVRSSLPWVGRPGRGVTCCKRYAAEALARLHGKVAGMMLRTAWVEGRAAVGAGVPAGQIGVDGERAAAGAAQDGVLLKPVGGPALCRMIGQRLVTRVARIVDTAAGKLDRDDVARAVVVGTPGAFVDTDAAEGEGKAAVEQTCHNTVFQPEGRKHTQRRWWGLTAVAKPAVAVPHSAGWCRDWVGAGDAAPVGSPFQEITFLNPGRGR